MIPIARSAGFIACLGFTCKPKGHNNMQENARLDRLALDASNAKALFSAALKQGNGLVKTAATGPSVAQDQSIESLEAQMRPSVHSVATMLAAAWKGN
jgi:hypothetical protein